MTSDFAVALHVLVYLDHRGGTLSSEALAANVCTNPARIRKVMARLKKAGLVDTKEGAEGGYHFTLDADEVDIRQVAEAVEERLVSSAWRPGSREGNCLIACGMGPVLDEMYQELDELCKERLAGLTIRDIEGRIFKGAAAPHQKEDSFHADL